MYLALRFLNTINYCHKQLSPSDCFILDPSNPQGRSP
ncbi:hypothetical protein OROGR_002898 [Orobanche gracilis]